MVIIYCLLGYEERKLLYMETYGDMEESTELRCQRRRVWYGKSVKPIVVGAAIGIVAEF